MLDDEKFRAKMTNSDPGGPKNYGPYGSGSTTLLYRIGIRSVLKPDPTGTIFFSDFQNENKKYVFVLIRYEVTKS